MHATRSPAGVRNATSATSKGMAAMRDRVSRFGRSVTICARIEQVQPSGYALDPLSRMKVCINPLRHLPADAWRLFQVAQPGHLHATGRAEMVQQRTLARGADALDLVQFARAQRFRPASPV